MGVKTIWELCLFQVAPLPHFKGCKWGYLFFGQKETGAETVAMATPLGGHFVSFVMHIYGAKFQEHCFISS